MPVREDEEEDSEERARRGAPDWALDPGALSVHIGWELGEVLCGYGSSNVDSGTSYAFTRPKYSGGGFLLGEMLG